MSDLRAKLAESMEAWGASCWGVADLSGLADVLAEEYADAWADYPRAVSIGVFFPRALIEQLAEAPTLTYQAYYDIVNARLNDISLRTALLLESEGWLAFPVPASQRLGRFKETAIFSHRTAAHLAGLGWIGKSLSLINPQVGPRIRLATVLTDAPLAVDKPLTMTCPANCTACRDACPSGAILGVPWQDNQPIEQRFQRAKCAGYLREVRQAFGKEICGRCLAACPFGKPRRLGGAG